MTILGIDFILINGEKIRVEIDPFEGEGRITGWWLYKDGKSRDKEIHAVLPYTRTVTSPNQP